MLNETIFKKGVSLCKYSYIATSGAAVNDSMKYRFLMS